MSNKFLQYDSAAGDLSDVYARINTNSDTIEAHIADTNNPHLVTLNELGGIANPLASTLDIAGYGLTNTATISGNGSTDVDIKNIGGTVRLSGDAVRLAGTTVILDSSLDVNSNTITNVETIEGNGALSTLSIGGSGESVKIFSNQLDLKSDSLISLQPTNGSDIRLGEGVQTGVVDCAMDIDMNQNVINNCLVVNNQLGQPLNLIGGSNVSAVILDATPTQGVIISSNVGASTDITGDTSLSLRSNAGSIDLFPSSVMGVIIGGKPRFAVDASEVNVGNDLNLNQNLIQNCSYIINPTSTTGISGVACSIGETTTNMSQTFTSNQASIQQLGNQIIRFTPTLTVSSKDIDMTSNSIIGCPEIVGNGGDMTIRNGGGESILLNSATNTIDIINNDLNMNNNEIKNVNTVSSDLATDMKIKAGSTSNESIKLDGTSGVVSMINPSNGAVLSSFGTGQMNLNTNLVMDSKGIGGCNEITASTTNNLDLYSGGGGGTVRVVNSNLDMNNNGILNLSSINNLSVTGGLYAGTSAGTALNTTTLTTLTPTTSVGSLTVPANGFSVGDSYHLVVAGDCDFFNNDTVQITLRYDGTNLAQSTVFAVENANGSNNVFEIEADFTIRSTGATGTVHTSGEFTYNKDSVDSKDFRGIRFNDTQVIDTTATATLDVLFQFVSRPGGSTLQTQLFRLGKVY